MIDRGYCRKGNALTHGVFELFQRAQQALHNFSCGHINVEPLGSIHFRIFPDLIGDSQPDGHRASRCGTPSENESRTRSGA